MRNWFVDVHPSEAYPAWFLDGYYCFIASIVTEYALRYMLLIVLEDSSTNLFHNALYDHHTSRFEIVSHGI